MRKQKNLFKFLLLSIVPGSPWFFSHHLSGHLFLRLLAHSFTPDQSLMGSVSQGFLLDTFLSPFEFFS